MTTLRSLSIRCLTLIAALACRDSATAPEPPGPVAAAQSDITVSTATVVSGDRVDLTLTTKDARGRPVTRGGHSVVFYTSGGSSTGALSPTTDRGNGIYVASFTGVVAGLATTIGATIDGESVTRPLPTIRVRPGAFSPAMSILTVTPRTILPNGRATLELVARDVAGNTLDTGGLQVTFMMTGGSASGVIGPVTDHANGRYSASFTASRVGTPLDVNAEVNGATVTTPAPTVSVARGVSPDLSVLSVSSDTVSVNATLRISLHVRDSADVPRTSGSDTIRFVVISSTGTGDGTIGDVRDHNDGTYSASFTATRAGDAVRIGASINGRSKNAPLPTVAILRTPVTPQRSTISVSTSSIEAGRSATFAAVVRDLNGEPVTGVSQSVRFTIGADGSSGGTIGPTREEGPGTYTATFTALRAGTPVTIGATLGDARRSRCWTR